MKTIFLLALAGWAVVTSLRAQITTNASVSPAVLTDGQTIILSRDGSASAGIQSTQSVVQKPGGSTTTLSEAGLSAITYTPNAGPGVYWFNFRITDNNSAYADQSIPFVVGSITSGGIPTFTVGHAALLNFNASSQDRIITSIAGSIDAGSWGDADYGSDPDPYDVSLSGTYQPWTAGTRTLTLSVISKSYGREDAATPATSGAPEEIAWSRSFSITVNKATPSATWTPPYSGNYQNMYYFPTGNSVPANREGYYSITSGDVSAFSAAVFHNTEVSFGNSNYYVAGPTSPITYRLAGTTTAFATGLHVETGTVVVEAVFPGNANYNSATSTVSFTVVGPGVPVNFQPIFGSALMLQWNAVSGAVAYDVYRNGAFLATVTSGTSYVDTSTPVAGTTATQSYSVRAVDSANRGSVAATATLANVGGALEVFTPSP